MSGTWRYERRAAHPLLPAGSLIKNVETPIHSEFFSCETPRQQSACRGSHRLERVKRLNELIQKETDRDKVLELTRELCRVLDGGSVGETVRE